MRDDQRRQLAEAFLKVVAVAVGVGAVIAIGVFIMVKALGFSDNTPAAHSSAQARLAEHAPDRALTPSGSPSPSEEPSATETSKPAKPRPSPRTRSSCQRHPSRSGRASGST